MKKMMKNYQKKTEGQNESEVQLNQVLRKKAKRTSMNLSKTQKGS